MKHFVKVGFTGHCCTLRFGMLWAKSKAVALQAKFSNRSFITRDADQSVLLVPPLSVSTYFIEIMLK